MWRRIDVFGSLRLRLFAMATFGIALTMAMAAFALVLSFQRHVERFAEHELQRMLGDVVAAVRIDVSGRPVLASRLPDPRYGQPYGGAYWQISQAGAPVLRSRSLWDVAFPVPSASDRIRATVLPLAGVEEGVYALSRTVTVASDSGPKTLALTTALDYRDLLQMRRSFTQDVIGALALIAGFLLAWALVQVRVGLRPVNDLEAQLERIQSGAERRLSGPFPIELQPLVAGLNDLLDHQDRITARARERAGSLAHGLKTPLTGLLGLVEDLRNGGRPAEARLLETHLTSMRGPLERELARAHISGPIVAGTTFDAADAMDRLLMLMQHLPRSEQLAWTCDVPPGTLVSMDPADFSEIVGNLLDNARKWARSRVAVSCIAAEQHVHVTIEDDGPGIPEHKRSLVLARGERGAYDCEGSGLGLAIVADVLAEYGISLDVGTRADGGCRIAFAVPLRAAVPALSRVAQRAAPATALFPAS
ncbi:MAG: HAMP domain-containing sensor histidine kinase [Alsobacter sp.]